MKVILRVRCARPGCNTIYLIHPWEAASRRSYCSIECVRRREEWVREEVREALRRREPLDLVMAKTGRRYLTAARIALKLRKQDLTLMPPVKQPPRRMRVCAGYECLNTIWSDARPGAGRRDKVFCCIRCEATFRLAGIRSMAERLAAGEDPGEIGASLVSSHRHALRVKAELQRIKGSAAP